MTTQNEKNARKTLVLQEILNGFLDGEDQYTLADAEEFQMALVKKGYLVMAL